VSKPTRRRQQPGSQPQTTRPAGPPAGSTPGSTSAAGGPGPSTRSVGPAQVRAGRRERQRSAYKPSFLERYRTPIFGLAAVLGVLLIGGFVFASASSPAFACSQVWTPTPTPSPKPGQTPNLGYVEPDMGNKHTTAGGQKVTYTYCPPASGTHNNAAGIGPIQPRVYGPDDNVVPQGWVHNLEHGGLVIAYTGTSEGATPDGQAKLKAFYDAFPPSPICGTTKGIHGPVVARFDQMATPFVAMVWGRVLPLDKWDPDTVLAFWNQWGDRTNLENRCAAPSSSPSPGASTEPSTSPSPAPSTGASTAPSPS
jgi:hypothetical protein